MEVFDTRRADRFRGLTATIRNRAGEVDGDLLSKTVAEWLGLAAIIYSAIVEAHPDLPLNPLGLEWIAVLMGWGAKSSFAYASKRRQDTSAEVARHKVEADAAAFERAAGRRVTGAPVAQPPAVGETLKPGRMPIVPTSTPIPGDML